MHDKNNKNNNNNNNNNYNNHNSSRGVNQSDIVNKETDSYKAGGKPDAESKKVAYVSPTGRLSFNLLALKKDTDDSDKVYAQVMFDMSHLNFFQAIVREEATRKGIAYKALQDSTYFPIRIGKDINDKREAEGKGRYEPLEDAFRITFKNGFLKSVVVVDEFFEPVLDHSLLYIGVNVRVAFNVYTYVFKGTAGVGMGLRSLQITGGGEELITGSDPVEAFKNVPIQ